MPAKCESERFDRELIFEDTLAREITFHILALSLCCVFACIAIALSIWHILQHALHYARPYEQKYIIRILAMIPIYAFTSFLSYVFYRNAVYYKLARDCYEAYAIASFFTLMCHYIGPNLHEQKIYLANIRPKNWAWPLVWFQKITGGKDKGWLRKPKSGLTWFNIVYVGIFQYCVIRLIFTLVAVIAQAQGKYCQTSTDPRFASLWVAAFDALSVTIAMFCLVQFYIQLKEDLTRHQPFLKVLSIKVVIFLCFWQSLLITILTAEKGPLKPTRFVAGPDLQIGIPCILICVEMAAVAVLHNWAFPWKIYDVGSHGTYPARKYVCGPTRALLEAIYPWDYAKAAARGFRWLFHGACFREENSSSEIDPDGKRGQREVTRACSEPRANLDRTGSKERKDRVWKTA